MARWAIKGVLFVAAFGFAAAVAAPAEAQPPQGCEGSAPQPDGKTVWELAGDGLVTGPLPALGEFAARTLGFGGRALEMAEARIYVRTLNRELEAFFYGRPCVRGDPTSNSERPILVPLLWDNAPAFQNRILGIVAALEFLPPVDKHEMQTIKVLGAKLMPTPLETPEKIREFIHENPPGTRFIARKKSGIETSKSVIEAARELAGSRGVKIDFCFGIGCVYKVK